MMLTRCVGLQMNTRHSSRVIAFCARAVAIDKRVNVGKRPQLYSNPRYWCCGDGRRRRHGSSTFERVFIDSNFGVADMRRIEHNGDRPAGGVHSNNEMGS